MEITTQQLERATQEWSKYAGESVEIIQINGILYALGSELGCLRLEHKMGIGRAEFSSNLNTWTYSTKRFLNTPVQRDNNGITEIRG